MAKPKMLRLAYGLAWAIILLSPGIGILLLRLGISESKSICIQVLCVGSAFFLVLETLFPQQAVPWSRGLLILMALPVVAYVSVLLLISFWSLDAWAECLGIELGRSTPAAVDCQKRDVALTLGLYFIILTTHFVVLLVRKAITKPCKGAAGAAP